MAHRDIVVVGASMGGNEALSKLVGALPEDLNAAVFVVMHMAPDTANYLPDRLKKIAPFPTAAAIDGEPIASRHIYVAVPDRHLMIEGARVRLSQGPRESYARPSVDVLFRSAAFHCGRRTIGIVLTGRLDDGTAGLWAVKDRGGVAIVQAPTQAAYPSMPMSAIRHVKVDHVLEIEAMGKVLRELTGEELDAREESAMPRSKLEIETQIALDRNALERGVRSLGEPSFYTCPDCHGSMVAIKDGDFKRFRCHTGHGYTPQSLHERGLVSLEETLWSALAQLEEREILLRDLEQNARLSGSDDLAAKYASKSDEIRDLAQRVREIARNPALEHREWTTRQ